MDGRTFQVYLKMTLCFFTTISLRALGYENKRETLDWDEDHPIGDVTKIDAKSFYKVHQDFRASSKC